VEEYSAVSDVNELSAVAGEEKQERRYEIMKESVKYSLVFFLSVVLLVTEAFTQIKTEACAPDSLVLKGLIPPEYFLLDTRSRVIILSGKDPSLLRMEVKGAAYLVEVMLTHMGLPLIISSREGSLLTGAPLPLKTEDGKIVLEENTLLNRNWFTGAEHIYMGKVKLHDYLFDSDPQYPLTFKIIKNMGYVYLCGRGTVTRGKDKAFHLGFNHKPEDWIRCLKQGNELERQGAAEALGWIGGNKEVAFLIEALKDKSWEVRRNAAEALGKIHDSDSAGPLSTAVKDENDWVSLVAMEALGKLGMPGMPYLLKFLDEGEGKLQENAIYALGASHMNEAIPHLVKVLDDESTKLRSEAIRSLGRIGSPACVEPLIDGLKDKDRDVREEAVKALREITGKNLGEDPVKWKEWWEENKVK